MRERERYTDSSEKYQAQSLAATERKEKVAKVYVRTKQ